MGSGGRFFLIRFTVDARHAKRTIHAQSAQFGIGPPHLHD